MLKFARLSDSHFAWTLGQQIVMRGLTAAKFLLAAHILGPSEFGNVAIALLALAAAEALTETGLQQAVVQSQNAPNLTQRGALWTLALARGALVALLIAGSATPLSIFFKAPDAAILVYVCAFVPLVRSSINPGVHVRIRQRAMRQVAIYEVSAGTADFCMTVIGLCSGLGALSMVVGTLTGEGVRVAVSWLFLMQPLTLTFAWKSLDAHIAFGKWIWLSGVLVFLLNQLDKVVVGRLLGAYELGLYQGAMKIAQLVVADSAIAVGAYLFPLFSDSARNSTTGTEPIEVLLKVSKRCVPAFACASLILILGSEQIIAICLGESWRSAKPVLQVASVAMFFGSMIAILVAFVRANGRPQAVVKASSAQLVVFASATVPLASHLGAVGVVTSLACSLFVCSVLLVIEAYLIVKR